MRVVIHCYAFDTTHIYVWCGVTTATTKLMLVLAQCQLGLMFPVGMFTLLGLFVPLTL